MSKARGPYRVDPLGYKKANEALDKMAENARELGLDYEPAQRTWVGLTKQEFNECVDGLEDLEDCWTAIEAKLKEKNT